MPADTPDDVVRALVEDTLRLYPDLLREDATKLAETASDEFDLWVWDEVSETFMMEHRVLEIARDVFQNAAP